MTTSVAGLAAPGRGGARRRDAGGLRGLAPLLAIPVPLVWAGFTLPPSSVTTIDFEPAGDGLDAPRCHGLGDLSHLGSGGGKLRPDPGKDERDTKDIRDQEG